MQLNIIKWRTPCGPMLLLCPHETGPNMVARSPAWALRIRFHHSPRIFLVVMAGQKVSEVRSPEGS